MFGGGQLPSEHSRPAGGHVYHRAFEFRLEIFRARMAFQAAPPVPGVPGQRAGALPLVRGHAAEAAASARGSRGGDGSCFGDAATGPCIL